MLVRGVPLWWIQTLLPLGFAAIALRLLWHSAASWRGRGVALLVAGAILFIGVYPPVPPSSMVFAALLTLLAATALGAPVFVALGGAALILFWGEGTGISSLSVDHYRQVVNPSFPTIPLFTLAGYFLAEGGASTRLIRVFQALFGHFRGGPAIVTALVCAFFTSFTGASGVTILALGGLLMPILLAAGYKERSALGLLTGAGSLGLLFPPCLPLILYAIIAQITLKEMFLGGLLPGMLLVAMTAWWGMRLSPPCRRPGVLDWTEARKSMWEAKWEVMLPLVALASLFAGFATPVEAAALTALLRLRRRGVPVPGHEDHARRAPCDGGVRPAGGRRAAHPGRGAGVHQLPHLRRDPGARPGLGDRVHSLALGLHPSAQPVSADCRLPDGHLLGHRRGGAVDSPHGASLRHGPGAPRHPLPGESRARLSDTAGGHEPLSLLLPVQPAHAGGYPSRLSHAVGSVSRVSC